jgi:hypothetical protein
MRPFPSGVAPSPTCSASQLPAAITRQGDEVAVGVADVDVEPERAAEGDAEREELTLTVAHRLARAEAVVVWEGELDTRRFVRVAFEVGVGLRHAEPELVVEMVPLADMDPVALTDRVAFREPVPAAEAAEEAPRAAMIAAPRCWTVLMNSPSNQA